MVALTPRRLLVLYPGDRRYPLAEPVEVVPLADLASAQGDSLFGRRR